MNPAEASILNKPEPFRSILLQLQIIVKRYVPEAVLMYKWKIPYFYLYGKKPLVYLNTTKEFVDLGFTNGFELTQHQDQLIGEKRNTVKSLRFYNEAAIDEQMIADLLLEAKSLID